MSLSSSLQEISRAATSFTKIQGFRMFEQMRSVQHMAALKDWGRRRGEFVLPPATEELGHDLRRSKDDLLVLSVETAFQLDSLRVRYLGPNMKRLWPRFAVGKHFLDRQTPQVERESAEDYVYVLRFREPHFRCLSLRIAGEELTSYERLILPFGAGDTVTSLICHVTLVSQKNGYSRDILSRGRIVAGLGDFSRGVA